MTQPIAVVTGASSGIGEATARRLAAEGFDLVIGARRLDRLEKLAAEIGARAVELDVTDEASVAAFTEWVPECAVLVNNAGGARGLAPAAETAIEDWRWMYEVNVLGSVRMVQALLPSMLRYGRGHVVNITSVAGLGVYEGGSGYTAAKHAQHALSETLRLELNGRPVRVTEIAPGMVKTDEFSLNRFAGDQNRADSVYSGVAEPLLAEDIADCVAFAVTRPPHVDVDLLVVRPLAQAASHKVHRVQGN
ncbi:SDR family NAD(P)-dependent oxidoreductase [Actinospica durhamensis]|uniref:SDR family NAD(P)-dependent oxidoreductase n=1 Tax=Actinospica durhamensis TaxID=1508375 RepID=A0A941ELZ2_9ACTN|nr:SDR family NAD(P)-dependent oxidoreductase [Actinospica durhamensis]MBR7833571.1 SDR family NAD(P)-dependent oxidoreductase [Actinospica durhamensis]